VGAECIDLDDNLLVVTRNKSVQSKGNTMVSKFPDRKHLLQSLGKSATVGETGPQLKIYGF